MSYFSVLCHICASVGFIITMAKAAYGKYLESILLMFNPDMNEKDIHLCVSVGYFLFGFGISGITNERLLSLSVNLNISLTVGILCMTYGLYISRGGE